MSHMSRVISRKFSFLPICLLVGGCALPPSSGGDQGPREKVFYAKLDHVWRAAQLVLQKYPMQVIDMDKGLLKTAFIKGDDIWVAPHKKNIKLGNGLRYQLRVRIVEGHVRGYVATKVTVHKEISLKRDFFSAAELIPSDGLEEVAILYRIGRELQIDKALERVQKKKSS